MKMGRIFYITLGALLLTVATTFAAGERLALVSSEGENSVTVIDLLTEKTLKVLPTGKVPHAMASTSSGKIFVNNRDSEDLTVLDAKTLAVVYKNALKLTLVDVAANSIIRTVDVAEMPAEKFKGAMMAHPSWSRDGKYVYCPDSVHKTIVKVDAATGQVAKRIALTGGNHYIHESPDGKLLYAVNGSTKDGTAQAHASYFTPDNRFFYAIASEDNLMAKTMNCSQWPDHPTNPWPGASFCSARAMPPPISIP